MKNETNLNNSPMWALETNEKKTTKQIKAVIAQTKEELKTYISDGSINQDFYKGFLSGTVKFLEGFLNTPSKERDDYVSIMHAKYESTIWYERKLVMFANIEDGIEKPLSLETSKAVHKAMIQAEDKWSVNPRGVSSNFEWGEWNAYLFGSRWIGGDELLSLDT